MNSFVVDTYAADKISGFASSGIVATATPNPQPGKPDQWKVISKESALSAVGTEAAFANRTAAFHGLCDALVAAY